MSDYDFRPGGSLKLKGGVVEGGIVKKKKKSKSKSKSKEAEAESSRVQELEKILNDERKSSSPRPTGSSRASPAIVSSDKKTAAEKRFEEVQKKRLAERVAKLATQTHKDRVNEFNSKLETLSEHHDIPKVGPG